MKLSLNWIKEFVDIPPKYSAKELAELLTLRTCEVEAYEDEALKFANMVVGKISDIRPHSNADKLRLVETDIGGKTVQIVCGGENLEAGMLVAVALPGALVKWHGEGELVELKETKIRGETSYGMICAEEEISLPPLTPRKGVTIANLAYHTRALRQPFDKLRVTRGDKPGIPLAKALGLNDVIFDIDNKSLTHRPDLWGHYGMAREFAAFLGKKLKPFAARNPVAEKGPKVKIEIQKREIAARFLSAIITGIRIKESPQFIKNRLTAVGMRPVNNIVDITNFVMHELGHPLHAFDRRVISNDTFVIRFARENEVIETLDHKKRQLSQEDALVTNGDKALGIAGVMGGLNSEVRHGTTEIILEAATWNPVMIRKTATRHGLRSDAAQRFEKSLDPEITGIAFRRACELILKICEGAHLAGPTTDIYPDKQKIQRLKTVTLNLNEVNRKIGAAISQKDAVSYLKALEFGVSLRASRRRAKQSRLLRPSGPRNDILKVTIPTFRATKDINIEDDLVEEIARMHGYEKIAPALPSLPIRLPQENRERILKHATRQIFSLGLGFIETNHYSFYGKAEIRKAALPEELHLKLDNPLTEDQTHLRISLLPNMLKSAALNLYHRKSFKLYEIGRTYIKTGEYFPREEKFIGAIVASAEKESRELFYDALGALETFLEKFGAKAEMVEIESPPPYAHPSVCAAAKAGGQEIAAVFEIHPRILKNFGIEKAQAAAFEINFTKLVAAGREGHAYRPLPQFPGIEIDVSVLVPKRIPAKEIHELIAKCDQALIANLKLIDTFEHESLGRDKKSLTFRVLLQSPDRTLADSEMKIVQERIFSALRQSGFAIRGT